MGDQEVVDELAAAVVDAGEAQLGWDGQAEVPPAGPTPTGYGSPTNTTRGGPHVQLADLELRHRRHARVEDRIHAGKDTELRKLPFHTADQNRAWVARRRTTSPVKVNTTARRSDLSARCG